MRRLQRSTVIPIVLLIYLCLMSYIGYPGYVSGQMSTLYYFGIIGSTLLVIILLHFFLKRKERLRKERDDDLNRNPH